MTIGDQKYGGPAFPSIEINEYSTLSEAIHQRGGMTLRDYFAAKAMQGLCTGMSYDTMTDIGQGIRGGKDYVEAAYALADKMLSVRGGEATPQEDK